MTVTQRVDKVHGTVVGCRLDLCLGVQTLHPGISCVARTIEVEILFFTAATK